MRRGRHFSVTGLLVMALLALPALGFATESPATDANTLETRQFHLDNAPIPASPGQRAMRQTVTAWQVTQGTWNGQILDGLSIVLVQSTSDAGNFAPQTNCYISQEASSAQRDALLAAFFAAQPQLAPAQGGLRIEPAVISLDVDGPSIVLHLGIIA